jgi:hypothetical protein
MSGIDTFIEQAWNDHVSDLPAVVARLDEGFTLLAESPARLNDFLQLAAHVHLEHRGDAQAMQSVLDCSETLIASQPDAQAVVDKARLTMSLLRGESPEASTLPIAVRVRAHGDAACGLAARVEYTQARRLLQAAAAIARDADEEHRTPAGKALAASYNNLASVLLDGARSPDADTLMLEAAAQARNAWGVVGTWLNVERAEYLLSITHAAAGQGTAATEHAQACASTCEANAADAFERFFAQEAMTRALIAQGEPVAARQQTARMQALLSDIADEGNRAYAASVLAKLIPTIT